MTAVVGELQPLVERTVAGLGYELVEVERAAGGVLRVTLDRDGAAITLEDCERVSHQLTHLFAVENVAYARLEVSSPGLDRPLRRARDFARFVGQEVRVQLAAPIAGRKRLRGRIVALEGDAGSERIRLELTPDDEAHEPVRRVRHGAGAERKRPAPRATVEIAWADVDKARLVPMLDFRSKQ